MRASFVLLCVGLLLCSACSSETNLESQSDVKLKGYVITTYSPGSYSSAACDASVANMSATGIDTVEIVATQYMDTIHSTNIAPAPATPTDADVLHVAAQIRARGMRVVLKPQVDSKDGVWRGEITFNTSAEWAAWFGNYTVFITHYAALAEAAGASFFNVGTELDATEGQEAAWRAVIAAVRGIFSGPLWYGCNWSPGVSKVTWWDALDFIGVDAYFPLANASNPSPTEAELVQAWQPVLANLSAASAQWGKQVVLAEVGYASFAGAAQQPWACCDGTPDLELQATLYSALYAAVWSQPYIAGIFPWAWSAGDYLPGGSLVPVGGARCSTDFNVVGKPAQHAIAAAYGGTPEPEPPASRGDPLTPRSSPAPPSVLVYANGSLAPGWQDWSFSANVSLSDAANPFPGHAYSLGASVGSYGAVALHLPAGVAVSGGYSALALDIIVQNASACSTGVGAWLCFCDGCSDAPACQGPYTSLVAYTAGGGSCALAEAWSGAAAHAEVPLAAHMPPGPPAGWPAVKRVQVGSVDAHLPFTAGLDNVRFV